MQNNPIKTIFVCEFITGGGFNHHPLQQELANQGQQMRDALLADLSLLPYQVVTTVDYRLTVPAQCDECIIIGADADVWQQWQQIVSKVDAVWFIAPESDGLLHEMVALATREQKVVIGSHLEAIKVCSLKSSTCQVLKQAGIRIPDTFFYQDWPRSLSGPWLAKPDDGAGCEETVCFNQAQALDAWLQQHQKTETHVIQQYIHGQHASISSLMHQGTAHVLSGNQQLITLESNSLHYNGCSVNTLPQYQGAFESIANQIAKLLPGLSGYIGIDVIIGDGDMISVIEINPRLTMSYVGLSAAIGQNVTARILNTLLCNNDTQSVV